MSSVEPHVHVPVCSVVLVLVTVPGCSIQFSLLHRYYELLRGDGVAQLVEHRLEIQRPEVRTPSGAQDTFVIIFLSQNVVLTRCRCAKPQCVYCIYVYPHKNDHVHTFKIL